MLSRTAVYICVCARFDVINNGEFEVFDVPMML